MAGITTQGNDQCDAGEGINRPGSHRPIGVVCRFQADGSGNFTPITVNRSGLITSIKYIPGTITPPFVTRSGTMANALSLAVKDLQGDVVGIGGSIATPSAFAYLLPSSGSYVDVSGGFTLAPSGNTTANALATFIINIY